MKHLLLALLIMSAVSCVDNYKNSLCGKGMKLEGLAGEYKTGLMGADLKANILDKGERYLLEVREEDNEDPQVAFFKICEVNSIAYFEFSEKGEEGRFAAKADIDMVRGIIEMKFLNYDKDVLKRNNISFEIVSSDWASNLFVDNIKDLDALMLESATSETSMSLIKNQL